MGDPATRTIRHELSLRSIFSVVAIVAGLWLVVHVWPILLLLIIALGYESPLHYERRHDPVLEQAA